MLLGCGVLSDACHEQEKVMIAHRRTWFYRLAGQGFAQAITFDNPMTAPQVRQHLRQMFPTPILELWARG